MRYEPAYESVHRHALPAWYDDAKFGIYIHWSLFSVPAFAGEQHRDISESFREDASGIWRNYPYAEWYLNSLRTPGSVTQEFHRKHYGNRSYESFQKDFEEQNADFDVSEWVKLIRAAGAKYAVFVTKHHDGYNLWPTANPNPRLPGYHSGRDFVGELCDAADRAGIRTGLYYSGVFDWTFRTDVPIDGAVNYMRHQDMPAEYVDYSVRQLKELIDRYRPAVLWNDIAFPRGYNLNELFAYYYNRVEDGVIDDRWMQYEVPRTAAEWAAFEESMKGKLFPPPPEGRFHSDFITAEYHELTGSSEKKWECTRGIGRSFGFNRTEAGEDYLTGKQIVDLLVRVVAQNGNLLLNIGPRADGSVCYEQVKPLREVGAWLQRNGEAIYGTRPHDPVVCEDQNGTPVYFTRKGDTVYAIFLAEELAPRMTIRGYRIPEGRRVALCGAGLVPWMAEGADTVLQIPEIYERAAAYAFRIEG